VFVPPNPNEFTEKLLIRNSRFLFCCCFFYIFLFYFFFVARVGLKKIGEPTSHLCFTLFFETTDMCAPRSQFELKK
jgi:hypothetical protein